MATDQPAQPQPLPNRPASGRGGGRRRRLLPPAWIQNSKQTAGWQNHRGGHERGRQPAGLPVHPPRCGHHLPGGPHGQQRAAETAAPAGRTESGNPVNPHQRNPGAEQVARGQSLVPRQCSHPRRARRGRRLRQPEGWLSGATPAFRNPPQGLSRGALRQRPAQVLRKRPHHSRRRRDSGTHYRRQPPVALPRLRHLPSQLRRWRLQVALQVARPDSAGPPGRRTGGNG